ncbi:MAG TPA: MFS transporter [Humisphaera sp.]
MVGPAPAPLGPDAAAPAERPAPGARKALVLLLSINLFNYIDRYILSAVEKPISEDFGVSMGAMGSLAFAFLVTYMLIAPVFGWLADRTRRWLLIGAGVLFWSLASGASGLAMNFAMLFALRCLIGVGEAAYGPVAPTIIADLYPVSIRGRVLAWFYAAIPVGSALGFVLGGQFAARGTWHWAFLLTLPPGILLGILCFTMPEPARGGGASAPKAKPTAADYRQLLRVRSYVLNCLGMAAMTFAIGGIGFFLPRYLNTVKGVDLSTASSLSGVIVAGAGLVATIAGGLAGDALRKRFGGAYLLVSGAAMLVGFPLFLAFLYLPDPWFWPALVAAVFFLFFNTGPSNTALANVTRPGIRATAFAVNILVIHAAGDAVSPFVIGFVGDHHGLQAGFMVVSVTMLVSGVLWLWGARYLAADTAAVEGRTPEPQGAM